MPIDFHFEVINAQPVSLAFAGLAKKVKDWTPIWKRVLNKAIKPHVKDQFDKEGGGGHGPWAPLSPRYAVWKEAHYPGKTILRRTDAMYNDLMSTEGDIAPLSLAYGSSLPYAVYHQTGFRTVLGSGSQMALLGMGLEDVPARRIVDTDDVLMTSIRREVTRGIVQYIRGYGFSVADSLNVFGQSDAPTASEAFRIGKEWLGDQGL